MALMTRQQYLEQATAAYKHVKQTMTVGAGNKILDQPGGVLAIRNRRATITKMRIESDARAAEMDREARKRIDENYDRLLGAGASDALGTARLYKHLELMKMYGDLMELNAAKAVEYGAGNCEEQSSLTFKFLKDRDVKPLDWMKKEGFFGDLGNHAFVIIGRDKKTDAADVSTWNPEVIYCDPYESKLGGLELIKECFSEDTISLLYRWDEFSKPLTR